MKTIRLIGGMSWESTVPYYRQITTLDDIEWLI
jgi:aspartate/glutamate racemase